MRPVSIDAAPPFAGAGARVEQALSATQTPPFEEVYEEHFDFVWRNVRRLGVAEAQVDDAVQEVFLTVHRRLGDFEGRSSLRTWIFGIVARISGTHRRTHRRKDPHARSPGGSVDADAVADERAAGPHEHAVRAEGMRVLQKLLDELDDDRRAVFVLAELEQMSAPDIADALGVNVNTVYARLRAARRDFEQGVAREEARDGWRLR